MPSLTLPKTSLAPRENLPAGFAQVEFRGFAPKLSKKGDSTNLNPEMHVINDLRTDSSGKPLNGQRVWDNANTNFMQGVVDFFHGFGIELADAGTGLTIPGDWDGSMSDPADPKTWGNYVAGPLLPNGRNNVGEIATVELAETSYNGKAQTKVKRYICKVPNCQVKHSENLIGSK